MINWELLTDEDHEMIQRILDRFSTKFTIPKSQKIDRMMDLSACHIINPLRLEDLFKADDFNFHHDLFGIFQNMDRDNCCLKHNFRPRFSK